jgi:hypothetical protein
LSVGLKTLSTNIDSNAAVFKRLQIAVTDSAGNLRATEAILGDVADRFAAMRDGATKSAIATSLFGEAGARMIPLLNGGSAGLRSLADEAQRAGLIISGETARASEQFNDSLTRLGAAGSAVGVQLASTFTPALTQIAQAMADSIREGGVLIGIFRGLAEAGKIALQGGVDNAVKSQRSRIAEIQGDIAKLEDTLKRPAISRAVSLYDRLVFGEKEERERKLAELRISLRDARTALEKMLSEPARAPTADLSRATASAINTAVADPDNTERAARRFAQVYLDQFEVLSRRGREVQQGLLEVFEEGNRTDARVGEEQARAIQALLAGTRSGQESAAIRDIETLNDALIAGTLKAEQYEEAYGLIEQRLNSIRGTGVEAANDTSKQWELALDRMEFVAQGWGNDFTETLARVVETGKLQFSDLVRSVLNDLVRLQIQRSITKPLFDALSGALGKVNFFGGSTSGTPTGGIGPGAGQGLRLAGARADGGPVSAGRAYLVGERGPEILVPRMSGTVLPNGMSTGSAAPIIINLSPGVDAGTMYRAAQLGASMAESNIARNVRIGAIG